MDNTDINQTNSSAYQKPSGINPGKMPQKIKPNDDNV